MFASTLNNYNASPPWWEEEHAAYSFSYVPVKTRLELINGSATVKLTDRRFMIQFMRNIRAHHEAEQRSAILRRKDAETMRWFGRVI